jgi:hypothetical protein
MFDITSSITFLVWAQQKTPSASDGVSGLAATSSRCQANYLNSHSCCALCLEVFRLSRFPEREYDKSF